MARIEKVSRSHGPTEYRIIMDAGEISEFYSQLQRISSAVGFDPLSVEVFPILPVVANALHILDQELFPTPF